MARIRTIKPEFWSSPDVGDVSRDARLTFIGLWNEADDHGRLEAVPTQIRATVFPYDDDVTTEQVCGWLNELARQGLVRLYAAGRRAYLHITGWGHHQRIDKPSQARCPDPDDCRQLDGITPTIQRDLARPSSESPDTPASLTREPSETVAGPPPPERRTVGALERGNVGPSPSTGVDQEDEGPTDEETFEEFWEVYPKRNGKKVGKDNSLIEWRKLTLEQRRRAYRGAKNLAASDQLPKDPERFLRRAKGGKGGFPFDDWQTPALEDGRSPPVATCPDCQQDLTSHDDDTCRIVKATS